MGAEDIKSLSISVVLPAYNEEANAKRAVEAVGKAVSKLVDDYEIVVVDDGSRDRTAVVTQELQQSYPNLKLVRHPVNYGYGAAVATGFNNAVKDLIFLTDSDLQFNLEELSQLFPLIVDGYDMAIGYRAPRRDPILRLLYGWGWNWLINLLFDHTARDVDCAFKLFKREVWTSLQVKSRGAMFSAEFVIRARRKGYHIAEVPVSHFPRVAGRPTGGRPDVILRAFKELLLVRLQLWNDMRRLP